MSSIYEEVNVIGSIKRGRGEELVVSEVVHRGKKKIDIRINYYNEDGELRPTQRGFVINEDKRAELAALILGGKISLEEADEEPAEIDINPEEFE